MSLLDLAGLGFSLLAIAVFVLLMRDWWRRRTRFQPLEHGSVRLGARAMSIAWLLLLVLSFVAGLHGTSIVQVTAGTYAAPGSGEPLGATPDLRSTVQQAATVEIPLPFYHWTRAQVRMDGELWTTTTTRSFRIPFWFLAGALLYVWLVMRERVTTAEPAGSA